MFHSNLLNVEFEYDFNSYVIYPYVFTHFGTLYMSLTPYSKKKTLQLSYSAGSGYDYWTTIDYGNDPQQSFCDFKNAEMILSFQRIEPSTGVDIFPEFGFVNYQNLDQHLLVSVNTDGRFILKQDGVVKYTFDNLPLFENNSHFIKILNINADGNKAILLGGKYTTVNDYSDISPTGAGAILITPPTINYIPIFGVRSNNTTDPHTWMFDYFYYRVNRLPINLR